MKKKKSFWSIIARYAIALLFISSWAVLGVAIAINTAKVDIGGKVTFQATDVYADITGDITGTKTTNNLEDIHLDASTTSFTSPSSWKNLVFDFVQDTNNIVFTITVTNKSAERSLWVDFDDTISATNVKITRKIAGTEVGAFSVTEVTASSTKAFEISMQVENLNKSVSGDFNLNLKLSNDEPVLDESEYSTLSFTYDDTAKTATVDKNSSNEPTGTLVIPGKVMHNGETYTITSIGVRGLADLENLITVTIPSTVTSIGRMAFCNCSSLSLIDIPSSVTSIEDGAFLGCESLTSITLPSSVTSIGSEVFSGCANLESIIVETNNTTYYSYENGLYTKADNTLLAGCKNTIIKEGTTKIGGNAFSSHTSLSSITIPSSVISIESGAFDRCSNLTSVTFEITTGWTVNYGSTTATPTISTTDLAANATLLRDTYINYQWTRA